MSNQLLNIVHSILGYSDAQGVLSNPLLKSVDWTRKFSNIPAKNVTSDTYNLQPGEQVLLFDGTRAQTTSFSAGTSQVSLDLLPTNASSYRLSITTGPGAFRTDRGVSATLDTTSIVTIAVNNNAVATFTLSGDGAFTGAQVGDVLKIQGVNTGDTVNNLFNPINSGYWVVLNATSSVITARRPSNQPFAGIGETVALTVSPTTQLSVYSAAGIQIGDTLNISGATFVSSSAGQYSVTQVSPTSVDFISATSLAGQDVQTVAALSDLVFYSNSKILVYIESDQSISAQYNADTSDNNRIDPIETGNALLPGYSHKWGNTWACSVRNLSQVNPATVKFIFAESL